MSGNTNETGDVGESLGKSSLFFLTVFSVDLGIGLPGDKVYWLGKQYNFFVLSDALSTTRENPVA